MKPLRAAPFLCVLLLLLAGPAAARAASPLLSATTASQVTETTATLGAEVDPKGTNVKDAHFQYIPLAAYEADEEQFGAGALTTPATEIPFQVSGKGDLTEGSNTVTNLSTTKGTFAPGQTITAGKALPAGTKILAVGVAQLTLSAKAIETKAAAALVATGPQPLSASLSGLTPGTGYRARAVAKNAASEEAPGPALTFYTYPAAPAFAPCPANEAFRTGELAPFGHPSALLPDCRAYEQVSPLDKDGSDALGQTRFARAAATGLAATFNSTSGIPGGEGSQQQPLFAGFREGGGWSTHGLLPPESAGNRAEALGWLPDFSQGFSTATRLEAQPEKAFYIRHGSAPAQRVTPYQPMGPDQEFAYAGSSADGTEAVFEVAAALPPREGEAQIPGAQPSASNVYAYDEPSATTHLASVMNTPPETAAALPKGAFAGPYNWAKGSLLQGGSSIRSFTQDEHAIAADGSVFFTAAGTGQLYERLHPTAAQSPLDGQGNCEDPALACTIHVSASHRTDCAEDPACGGDDQPDPAPDPAGPQPAAFQAATAEGSSAFFTSAEELTDDANTGPAVPPAQIGRALPEAADPQASVEEGFLPAHALDVAVDPKGEYIYWADPVRGTIGRAKLTAPEPKATVEPEYIVPGETSFETRHRTEPGVIHSEPSRPRYVAIDEHYVYWTNTGPLGEQETFGERGATEPVDQAGTIGRAKIGAEHAEEVLPQFIKGASNPQGIAVNATQIYWVNDGEELNERRVSRADLDGTHLERSYFVGRHFLEPFGIALDESHFYLAREGTEGHFGTVSRFPFEDPNEEGEHPNEESFGGPGGIRDIALDGSHVYWTTTGHAIGRNSLASGSFAPGGCGAIPGCSTEFFKLSGIPFGITSSGEHLYWSTNGESLPPPGSDLYRYDSGGALTDLTPDSADTNGAEVKGVIGASADGSSVYFVANGDLDGGGDGFHGSCHGPTGVKVSGRCNLYRYHQGAIEFIAPLKASGGEGDASDWYPSEEGAVGSGFDVTPRTSFISPDGETLVFLSSERLSADDNEGQPAYYRYRAGEPIACLSCSPVGTGAPRASQVHMSLPGIAPSDNIAAVQPRNLSLSGNRFFFQSVGALVPGDVDGAGGCPAIFAGEGFTCQDVYEWEAPGEGSCKAGAPPYSAANGGCLYLLSPGEDAEPSWVADASSSGNDVFLFTRAQMVGQDEDSLIDLYDARVGGGLAAQNPLPGQPCQGEAGCRPAGTPPPVAPSPQSAQLVGPPNPEPPPSPRCRRPKVLRHGKCVKKPEKHKPRHRHHSAGGNR